MLKDNVIKVNISQGMSPSIYENDECEHYYFGRK